MTHQTTLANFPGTSQRPLILTRVDGDESLPTPFEGVKTPKGTLGYNAALAATTLAYQFMSSAPSQAEQRIPAINEYQTFDFEPVNQAVAVLLTIVSQATNLLPKHFASYCFSAIVFLGVLNRLRFLHHEIISRIPESEHTPVEVSHQSADLKLPALTTQYPLGVVGPYIKPLLKKVRIHNIIEFFTHGLANTEDEDISKSGRQSFKDTITNLAISQFHSCARGTVDSAVQEIFAELKTNNAEKKSLNTYIYSLIEKLFPIIFLKKVLEDSSIPYDIKKGIPKLALNSLSAAKLNNAAGAGGKKSLFEFTAQPFTDGLLTMYGFVAELMQPESGKGNLALLFRTLEKQNIDKPGFSRHFFLHGLLPQIFTSDSFILKSADAIYENKTLIQSIIKALPDSLFAQFAKDFAENCPKEIDQEKKALLPVYTSVFAMIALTFLLPQALTRALHSVIQNAQHRADFKEQYDLLMAHQTAYTSFNLEEAYKLLARTTEKARSFVEAAREQEDGTALLVSLDTAMFAEGSSHRCLGSALVMHIIIYIVGTFIKNMEAMEKDGMHLTSTADETKSISPHWDSTAEMQEGAVYVTAEKS
jgi:hypothetical protein